MISVEVIDLVKRFGETVALDRVTLKVAPGELFFLLGPSGCGKTTLLRTLAGFYLPDAGKVFFGDEEVTRLEPHRRNTGMVFQSYALWPHLTVAQNVAFGLEERKVPRPERERRVAEALEAVDMPGLGARKPNQLSGGQQQRVALARALVVRPRCLLLDEPLSNLDAKLRQELRAEIRRVCKDYELTTVYVTHDQKEALSTADRMAVLDGGRVLQVGSPEAIYKRPANRFVAGFIGETNFVAGRVTESAGGFTLVETGLGELQGVTPGGEELAWGTEVVVSLRPECIHLETTPVEENGFPGHIGEAAYYGEVAHYRFRTRGETELKVSEINPRYLNRSGQGGKKNTLFAWADPDDVVVLTAG